MLGAGYRGWDDEFKDGWFDVESAVNAVTVQIADEDEARRVVACLDALQVFDREESQLRLEPPLGDCVARGT
ncbi:hypothetical protein ADK75_13370 [Streptomyces virginiae]|uniref:Uncharacterized protein n=1 Tax=Streptomyces virginiae TaxID=1961 RepID=A0A0L8MW51_STRVG|nr:hypothetical protein [Streptomyces virginiae]KOG54626.1 hypothetical protein ADK75_13370 [Streptomyces virginiae]